MKNSIPEMASLNWKCRDGIFSCISVSHQVLILSVLVRKNSATFAILVTSDCFQPQMSANVTLRINILDVNDNSPKCVESSLLKFNDDVAVGEVFGRVIASDPDEGINGSVSFRVQNVDANFGVSSKGM